MTQVKPSQFTGNLSEYQQRDISACTQLAAKIAEFYPAEVLIEVSKYDGKNHYERCDVWLKHPLQIRVEERKGKYTFYAWKLHDLRNVSFYDKQRASDEIREPQQVGVLTEKKVKGWVEFYEKLYKVLEVKNSTMRDKIQQFRDSLKGLPVHWYGQFNEEQQQTRGSITRGGLIFEFSIEDYTINKEIKVEHGHGRDLETFLKMADNKF